MKLIAIIHFLDIFNKRATIDVLFEKKKIKLIVLFML